MSNYPAKISFDNHGFIKIGLPITNHGGKIRVKEKSGIYDFGKPFFPRSNIVNSNCYIEWQIGYDNAKKDDKGVISEISRHGRNGKIKYGFELTNILYIGVKNHVYPESIIDNLLKFAVSVNEDSYIDKVAEIERTPKAAINLCGLNFQRIDETYPVFFFAKKEYNIEVVLKHRQFAAGFQPMIYICLPITGAMDKSIVGRIANLKEFLDYKLEIRKNNFVFDTFKIFSLASNDHNEDIKNILTTLGNII